MIKKILVISGVLFCCRELTAQVARSLNNHLITLNQQIDNYVVEKNTKALDSLYADDFIFTHGTGWVDNKSSWLKSVGNNNSLFLSRKHDSVTVEMHDNFVILKGRLDIERKDPNRLARYYLRYIRVYALKNKQWQLASHTTTHEAHLQ